MKICVAVSSGVDSTACLVLLKNQGYDLIAVNMVLSETNECISDDTLNSKVCCGINGRLQIRNVCRTLGIPFYSLDLKTEFKQKVIEPFVKGYYKGQTRNPCVDCNTFIKFEALFDFADQHGCDMVATGHYAKIKDDLLYRATNRNKDQSYYLSLIQRDRLARIVFPLQDFKTKQDVRDVLTEAGFPEVAQKKESQGICFVQNGDYRSVLERYKPKNTPVLGSGSILNQSNQTIGQHGGIENYTVGQRVGINGQRKYVFQIRSSDNSLVVSDTRPKSNQLTIKDINWLLPFKMVQVFLKNPDHKLTVKIRSFCEYEVESFSPLTPDESSAIVTLKVEALAITPGQTVTIYYGELVLGGSFVS